MVEASRLLLAAGDGLFQRRARYVKWWLWKVQWHEPQGNSGPLNQQSTQHMYSSQPGRGVWVHIALLSPLAPGILSNMQHTLYQHVAQRGLFENVNTRWQSYFHLWQCHSIWVIELQVLHKSSSLAVAYGLTSICQVCVKSIFPLHHITYIWVKPQGGSALSKLSKHWAHELFTHFHMERGANNVQH